MLFFFQRNNHMKKTLFTAALGLSFVLPQAEAATIYTFSFSNVDGAVSGTVSGTVTLPDGDGTFAATSVLVTSAPAALGYTLPFEATTVGIQPGNVFIVTGGAINAAASNFAFQSTSGPLRLLALNFGSFGSLMNLSGFVSFTSGVSDSNNTTLTYSSAPTGVPELDATGAPLALAWLAGALALARRKAA
jgi:hypothetical protein